MFTVKNLLILIGRHAIVSLIVVSITVIAIFFISKEVERISDSVALNHRLESELKKRTELLEALKNDVQRIGTNDIQIDNAFISSEDISGFINTLDNLAQKESITQVYRFETPIPSSMSAPFPISTISYSDSLTTNVSSFSNYLKEFEKLPYFTKIDGFNISSQDKTGWLGTSTISFRATLYTKSIQ
ncbi:MAG: hypothetical protein WCO07_00735 [bacterium]